MPRAPLHRQEADRGRHSFGGGAHGHISHFCCSCAANDLRSPFPPAVFRNPSSRLLGCLDHPAEALGRRIGQGIPAGGQTEPPTGAEGANILDAGRIGGAADFPGSEANGDGVSRTRLIARQCVSLEFSSRARLALRPRNRQPQVSQRESGSRCCYAASRAVLGKFLHNVVGLLCDRYVVAVRSPAAQQTKRLPLTAANWQLATSHCPLPVLRQLAQNLAPLPDLRVVRA